MQIISQPCCYHNVINSGDPHNRFEEERGVDNTIFSGIFLLERHDSEACLLGKCIHDTLLHLLVVLS